MANISQEQALALADGFIDKQGSDRTGLFPRNVISEVFLIAAEMSEDAQNNLEHDKKVSSGALSSSIKPVNPQKQGSVVSMDVEMNFYGKFVNKGVKGLKSGHSNAGYSFKTPMPSQGMVKAIQDWIKRGHISSRTTKKYATHGRHDAKQRSLSNTSLNAAFAIARGVKMKGLKPSGFFDKAAAAAQSKYGARLGAALKIDLIDTFTQ